MMGYGGAFRIRAVVQVGTAGQARHPRWVCVGVGEEAEWGSTTVFRMNSEKSVSRGSDCCDESWSITDPESRLVASGTTLR